MTSLAARIYGPTPAEYLADADDDRRPVELDNRRTFQELTGAELDAIEWAFGYGPADRPRRGGQFGQGPRLVKNESGRGYHVAGPDELD